MILNWIEISSRNERLIKIHLKYTCAMSEKLNFIDDLSAQQATTIILFELELRYKRLLDLYFR